LIEKTQPVFFLVYLEDVLQSAIFTCDKGQVFPKVKCPQEWALQTPVSFLSMIPAKYHTTKLKIKARPGFYQCWSGKQVTPWYMHLHQHWYRKPAQSGIDPPHTISIAEYPQYIFHQKRPETVHIGIARLGLLFPWYQSCYDYVLLCLFS
jgi:hypothetical protein